MKRLLASFLAVTSLCLPAFADDADAPKHPLRPMLWKIEGKGLEKPSWLFGTIHIGTGPVANLHPAAEKAFESADAVFTEVSMDTANQMAIAGGLVRQDGRSLSDSIGPELADLLTEELAAINPALGIGVLDKFKTWAVAITLPMLKYQLGGAEALDAIIWKRAEKDGKATAALEELEDQTGIFDKLAENEQVTLLGETLRLQREAREKGEEPVGKLIDTYVSGDDKAIIDEIEKQYKEMAEGDHAELGKKLMKALIDDRNVGMAKVIDTHLKAEPGKVHFFAAGTAHYLGKASVVDLLTEKGYRVTRITE
ncbi:MAG: TraB/GumN family protein [Akkermansiaceae bacterium]|nr:TraB/GumN family protein [Akkermansiaceae bacterium]